MNRLRPTLRRLGCSTAALVALGAATPALAERGSDGELRLMLWQAPSTMNIYLTTGTKDMLASSLVLEPLAGFAPDGSIFPRLAEDIPTVENGGVAGY